MLFITRETGDIYRGKAFNVTVTLLLWAKINKKCKTDIYDIIFPIE